jgi:hypothetical protein
MDGTRDGGLAVLCMNVGVWSVHRFDPEGVDRGSWKVPVGPQPHGMRIALAPSGEVAVLGSDELILFAADGERIEFPHDLGRGLFTGAVFDDRGALWLSHFDRRVILEITPDRNEVFVHELNAIPQNEGLRPIGLDWHPQRYLAIVYEHGLVQLVGFEPGEGLRRLKRSFDLRFERRTEHVTIAIPESGWLHAASRPASGWLSYDDSGRRRMSALPRRSLFGSDIGQASVIAAVGEDLFVHDQETGAIWRIEPLADGE